ncbi:hypothetical protein Q5P01_008472 [Channa striata]|uniref:Uncharacterized protein n=1 Tax=Channa striata TaxID=64152 RepID=A0AA88N445_CHASR|nr:hypothetical protein Q5P01_008472 [Channa striata]
MLRFAAPTGSCSPLCASRAFRHSYRDRTFLRDHERSVHELARSRAAIALGSFGREALRCDALGGPRVDPGAAEETLRAVARQGWGSEVGVRLAKANHRGALHLEEVAAVLETLLHAEASLRVAMVDADVQYARSEALRDALAHLYSGAPASRCLLI